VGISIFILSSSTASALGKSIYSFTLFPSSVHAYDEKVSARFFPDDFSDGTEARSRGSVRIIRWKYLA
jgi:hypothetical protein